MALGGLSSGEVASVRVYVCVWDGATSLNPEFHNPELNPKINPTPVPRPDGVRGVGTGFKQ